MKNLYEACGSIVGQVVIVKEGASKWMKRRGHWMTEWPDSIDGMEMVVKYDYSHLSGDDSHYWCENETVKDCGINPEFLELA